MKIIARRWWGAFENAEIDIEEVSGVRWDNKSGLSSYVCHPGVALYGYIDYNLAVEVGLSTGSHSGHSAKVIFHKCDNAKKPYSTAYHTLAAGAIPFGYYN